MVVDVGQVVPGTVTPCAYGGGMDISSGANGSEASAEGFVSVVASMVGGLEWGSMPGGERRAWLSALTVAEGAIAASRAVGVASGAGTVGAAERTAELVRATGMSGRDAAGVVKAADVLAVAPEVVECLATGAITTGHVDALMRDLGAGERLAAVAGPGGVGYSGVWRASTASRPVCVAGRPVTTTMLMAAVSLHVNMSEDV